MAITPRDKPIPDDDDLEDDEPAEAELDAFI
jgi:hypothetical protein